MMTVAQMQLVADGFTLGHPFTSWDAMVKIESLTEAHQPLTHVRIVVNFTVPDRETGEPRNLNATSLHSVGWPSHQTPEDEVRDLLRACQRGLQGAVMHEFREALHFKGVRIDDPHRDDGT